MLIFGLSVDKPLLLRYQMNMRFMNQTLIMSCALFMVACGSSRERGDVWSNYDYLTPVPENSGVVVQPSARNIPYNYYRQIQPENDDSYVIPYQYGVCSDGRMGCE